MPSNETVLPNHFTKAPEASNPATDFLAPDEAAAFIGVTAQTLAAWRCAKRYGLAYVKVGRLVRYRKSDLIAWLESRVVSTPTS